MITLSECNPFLRQALILNEVLESKEPRLAYDHRIFYILDGDGYIIINGEKHMLSPDFLIFFRPAVKYFFRGKMKVAVLNFDLTRQCSDRKKSITPSIEKDFDENRLFDLTFLDCSESPLFLHAPQFKDYCVKIVHTFTSATEESDAACSAMLKFLLSKTYETARTSTNPQETLINELLRYIRSNAADIVTNEEISAKFGYSPIYLSSLLKRLYGKTLHQTVLEEKIKLSKQLLLSSGYSIEQIALYLNFSSRSHFCTVFRTYTGITPLEYKNQKD